MGSEGSEGNEEVEEVEGVEEVEVLGPGKANHARTASSVNNLTRNGHVLNLSAASITRSVLTIR